MKKKQIYITNNDHHKLLMVWTKYDINAVHSCLNHFRFRWWTKDHDKWQRMCTLHDFLNVNCRFRFYIIIRNGGYNLQIEIMHDHIYGDHDAFFFIFSSFWKNIFIFRQKIYNRHLICFRCVYSYSKYNVINDHDR